jgi:hypothetical protein
MPTGYAATEVVASAARTTTGNSSALELGGGDFLNLLVSVTAVAGTPSMTLSVEWSHDGGTTFAAGDPADAFTAITTAVARAKQFTVKGPHYRLVWTITGGTPSLTFSVREYVS